MSNNSTNEVKPIWSLNYEEGIYGDSWNRKIYSIWTVNYFYDPNNNWRKVYTTNSYELAKVALEKYKDYLQDAVIIPTLDNTPPVMFEYGDQIYHIVNIDLGQGVVYGEQIKGNKFYGNIHPKLSNIVIDFVKEAVTFYQFGDALVKNGQLFLNGELLLDTETFKNVCLKCGQNMDKLNTYPDEIIAHISGTYNTAYKYVCDNYSCKNIQKENMDL